MSQTISIPNDLFEKALTRSQTMQRSVDGQVTYWADIGRIAEDNPNLTFIAIRDLLIGWNQLQARQVEPYKFNERKKKKNASASTDQTLFVSKDAVKT